MMQIILKGTAKGNFKSKVIIRVHDFQFNELFSEHKDKTAKELKFEEDVCEDALSWLNNHDEKSYHDRAMLKLELDIIRNLQMDRLLRMYAFSTR